MNKENYSKIVTIVCIIAMIITVFLAYMFSDNKEMQEEITKQTIDTIKEIVVSKETEDLAIETKEATNRNEDLETKEQIKSTEQEEQEVIDESAIETDAVVEQENISYDGDNTGKGKKLLGKYQGLTYYSQADKRWANKMYSSINKKSQTMKTSACGPTSAAMIVSSSKGTILPTTMAKLFVDNGYRTANNGTAWSAYSFVADYFDFKEYHTTKDFNKAMDYLKQRDSKGNSKYYIIASCGSGLFTTSGHYIVLAGLDNNTIKIYDPYIYKGKFTTPSRKKANVKVQGNTAYVTKTNFKKYANYKNFWIYSNDNASNKTNKTSKKEIKQNIYKVTCKKLNIRKSAKIQKSNIVGTATKNTKFNILETKKIGKYTWGRAIQGWICLNYCKKI